MAIALTAPSPTVLLPGANVAVQAPPSNRSIDAFVGAALDTAVSFAREVEDTKNAKAIADNYASYYESKGQPDLANLIRGQAAGMKVDAYGRAKGEDTNKLRDGLLSGALSFAQKEDEIETSRMRQAASASSSRAISSLGSVLNGARSRYGEHEAQQDANMRASNLNNDRRQAQGLPPLPDYKRVPNPFKSTVEEAESAYRQATIYNADALVGGGVPLASGGVPAISNQLTEGGGYSPPIPGQPDMMGGVSADPSAPSEVEPQQYLFPGADAGGPINSSPPEYGAPLPPGFDPGSDAINTPAPSSTTQAPAIDPSISITPQEEAQLAGVDPARAELFRKQKAAAAQEVQSRKQLEIDSIDTIARTAAANDPSDRKAIIAENAAAKAKVAISEIPDTRTPEGKARIAVIKETMVREVSVKEKEKTLHSKWKDPKTGSIHEIYVDGEGKYYVKSPGRPISGTSVSGGTANPEIDFRSAGFEEVKNSSTPSTGVNTPPALSLKDIMNK